MQMAMLLRYLLVQHSRLLSVLVQSRSLLKDIFRIFQLEKKYGVTDVKDVINLSNDDQLRAFSKHALENKLPFNSIIGPRTQSISEPLLDGIRQTGGKVIRFDPTTGQFKNIDIGLSGPWKK